MRSAPQADAVRAGDPAAIGRALSFVLQPGVDAAAWLAQFPVAAERRRVGFTGPPGVGKSSLLREITRELRRRGEAVGILAVDPMSVRSGGAYLGDRVRLEEVAEDDGVFVRSLAHRGAAGAPTPSLSAASRVLEASGRRWVLIETVGIGQTETDVFEDVDVRVLVLSPDLGDWHQMLKGGFQETADLVVVSKSDRPGADAWVRELREILTVEGTADSLAVLATCADSGAGVKELVDAVDRFAAAQRAGEA